MLHELPITNARLQPCAVPAEQLSAVPGGHFCGAFQRVVHDFTQASQAALARVQAAAASGRICGRFRAAQIASADVARLQLRPRWRLILAALVLVLFQGLSARDAWAQLRGAQAPHTSHRPAAKVKPKAGARPAQKAGSRPYIEEVPALPVEWIGLVAAPDTTASKVIEGQNKAYTYVEQMPQPPGGMAGLMTYIQKNLRYPGHDLSGGTVVVNFIVENTGQLTALRISKGLSPALDAGALRLLRQMPAWTPGRQNGRPVRVAYTLPIIFETR